MNPTRPLALAVLGLAVTACLGAPVPPPVAAVVPGPRIQLPAGSPLLGKPLAVATATTAGKVETDGRYSVATPPAAAQLVFASAASADQETAPTYLLRIARPGVAEDLNAASTARALVLLAPFVAHSDLADLAVLDPLVAGLAETKALAAEVAAGLKRGDDLETMAATAEFQTAYSAAVAAALAVLDHTVLPSASVAPGQKAGPLSVEPAKVQGGIQVVADPDDPSGVLVRNYGGRYLSAWVGPPGADQVVGFVSAAPSTFSLDNVVAAVQQGTLLAAEETPVPLAGYGMADLRLYGPGLLPAAAGCPSAGLTELKLVLPTLATLIDRGIAPIVDLVLGVKGSSLGPWQDLFIQLTLAMAADGEILQALQAKPPAIGKAAWASVKVAMTVLASKAIEYTVKTVDFKIGNNKKGPKFQKISAAYLRAWQGGSAKTDDIAAYKVGGKTVWMQLLLSTGVAVGQAVLKQAILPLKLASIAGSAVDLGKAVGTVAAGRPAECFEVAVDATCGDADGDGYTALPKPLLGCNVKPGDCNDNQKAQHPGVGELCDLVDNDCNAQTDDVPTDQLQSDPSNCGQCGKSCLGGQSCAKGKCGIAAFSDPTDKQTTQVNVTVTQIEQAQGGKVKVYASVQTQSGDPVEQLTTGNFGVEETVNGVSLSVPVDTLEIAEESSNGLRAALVIDSSGSMYTEPPPSALDLAKAAAKEFVSYLKPGDEVAIVDFASKVIVQQGLTNNKLALFSAIDKCDQGGGTAMFEGALMGVQLVKGLAGQRAVLVLTDGEDTASACESSGACLALVGGAAKNASVPIYTIGLGLGAGSQGESDLLALALASNAGGKGIGFYPAPAPNQLKALYEKVATILKKTYVVGWYTSAKPGQQASAKVTVTYQAAAGTLKDTFSVQYIGK